MARRNFVLLGAIGVLLSYLGGVFLPSPPACSDATVAELSVRFQRQLVEAKVTSQGEMLRDRDTFFWSLFTDHFGSNPNTPYMWLALPAFGFFLPSPMWHMKRQDAVLLIARRPPQVEYFSFTSFALWVPSRGLQFSSLGDSVNNLNLQQTEDGIFAHILTASRSTFQVVQQALLDSGLPNSAINLRVIPSDIGALFDDWTHFETVLRLFRFENQSQGDAYLRSHYPVFYIKGQPGGEQFPTEAYKERKHPDSKHERDLEAEFDSHNEKMLKEVGEQLEVNVADVKPVKFAPLMIQGLECLKHDTQCLGDCPDAAYYGPYIREDSDVIDMLSLEDDEVHLVGLVNHRYWNVSVYGSLAALRSASSKHSTLSKTRMNIRATPLGVTTFDFKEAPFVSWAFSRSPELCQQLSAALPEVGCSVVEERHVANGGFLTYCERIYLNPTTGTGPHWDDLLPARLFQLKRRPAPSLVRGLPDPIPVQVFNASIPMHFTHIVKTGGESLELHLAPQPAPRLDYSACRKAALSFQGANASNASSSCATAARAVSIALCGLNCECCAKDVRKISGGFHGTLIRSPRAHSLSIFSQCHVAHQNSWQRILEDLPQYLAEGILRGTERACGSYCTTFESEWEADLRGVISEKRPEEVQVIPFLHNMQSHTLTCSTTLSHSLGQHFRLKEEAREPSFAEANASLHSFDWIGLTDLFEHSVCLLHFQANGSLPARCNCDAHGLASGFLRLPRFTHGVQRRDAGKLPQELLQKIDNLTAVDAQLFASALRLLLGRLRYVEQVTQTSLLRCIRWRRLWQTTRYIPGLWAGPSQLLPS